MNTNGRELKHRELTQKIIGVFYQVYNELGFGFLESVYHKSLVLALMSDGLRVCSPVVIPVWFRGQIVGDFKGDVMVEQSVLLELKSARCLDCAHPGSVTELSSSHRHRSWPTAEFRCKARIQEADFR
jgi:GxxExxY protein